MKVISGRIGSRPALPGGNPTPEYWVEKIELRLIKFVKQRVLGSCDSLSRADTILEQKYSRRYFYDGLRPPGRIW